MKRGIECFVVAEMLVENHILGCQHGLAPHIVGIHALPAARQRTTVEDNHQPVVVGIAQDGLIKAHRLLLVAAEEVHLDAPHALLLQPTHLTFTGNRVVHDVYRALLDVVPVTAGTVPQEKFHALAACVTDKLFHPLMADIVVPPVVYQGVFVAHGGSHVDIAHLIVVVDTVVLPENPAPRTAPVLILMLCGETGFHYVPRNGGLHDGSQVPGHRERTPRRMAGQGKGRFRRAVTVVFFRHRESHSVQAVLRVAQAGTAIAAVHARFAHEHPTVFTHMEQSGEGVAVAIL